MAHGVELIRDVPFGTGGGRPLRLHILRPQPLPSHPLPVLVGIHGGGWPEFSSQVNAVCDLCGPTDFLRVKDLPTEIDRTSPDAPEALLIGGPLEDHAEQAARANPITYITRDAPPFLIIHGEEDTVVPLNRASCSTSHSGRPVRGSLCMSSKAPVTFLVGRKSTRSWTTSSIGI